MRHFGDGGQRSYVTEHDERLSRLEREYSDDEILIEARRRGLLVRVEAETAVPVRYIEHGYPREMQIEKTFQQLAFEAAKVCVQRRVLPAGAKWSHDEDRFREKFRVLRMALNFVIDKR